ncbi:hypothetical protein N7451_001664 [Penicillium sp. IBT 35674x]|nr:hypothetical protein N7451_001664 [Penicillium sp. IBT 35674x]
MKSHALIEALAEATSQQKILCSLAAITTYLVVVSSIRFQRRSALHKKYPYQTRDLMSKMTNHDAWEIQRTILQMEFPFIVLKSLQFALFRLSDSATSFKRYADTGTLIGEFMAFDPNSERAQTAIARTSFLHKGYRANGKTLEEDMLYTLSLFATEPIRFVKLYEWREMTEMERCAVGTYWKSLGDALGISYDIFTGWKRNKEIADKTIDVLVYNLPGFLKPLGVYFASFLMDDRLRNAMMLDRPPAFFAALFGSMLQLRRLYLRYVALPRPTFMRLDVFTDETNENGRNMVLFYEGAPFYVQPTIWNRWGPVALFKRALGQPLPGDGGNKYYPQGYYTPDLGRKYFEGKGRKELELIKESIRIQRTGQ